MIQFGKRMGIRLVVVGTVACHINSLIDSLTQGSLIGHAFSCYVERGIIECRGAYKGKARQQFYPFIGRQGHEGRYTLVVIHGQYAIEPVVEAIGKEVVGGIGTKGTHLALAEFFYGRHNHLSLFCSQRRIQREHSYPWRRHTEISPECIGKQMQACFQTLRGDMLDNIFHSHMLGHQSNTHTVVEVNGHRLTLFGKTFLYIVGLSLKVNSLTPYGSRIDRRRYKHIKQMFVIIINGTVERLQCSLSGLFCRTAQFNLYLFIESGKKIHSAILCIGRMRYDAEIGRNIECLAMIGCHLGRTVDDGRTEFQHLRCSKSLKNKFISNTIGIAVGNCHTYFSIFFHE